MKFGFEIKYTLIWDNLNVKWNGFKNEYLKLNLKLVEILKIIWFEKCEVLFEIYPNKWLLEFIPLWMFQVKSDFDRKLYNWTIL